MINQESSHQIEAQVNLKSLFFLLFFSSFSHTKTNAILFFGVCHKKKNKCHRDEKTCNETLKEDGTMLSTIKSKK
jgi:hypothetical protein